MNDVTEYPFHTHAVDGVIVHVHNHPGGDVKHDHPGWTLTGSLIEPARLTWGGQPATDEIVPLDVLNLSRLNPPVETPQGEPDA